LVLFAPSSICSPPCRLTIPAHPLPGFPQAERICLPYSLVKKRFMVKRILEPLGSQKRAEAVRFCERRIPFTLVYFLSYAP
jgi:hypothetical protein